MVTKIHSIPQGFILKNWSIGVLAFGSILKNLSM